MFLSVVEQGDACQAENEAVTVNCREFSSQCVVAG